MGCAGPVQILQVLRHCHRGRQTMLFSATLSASISSLALLALQSPLHITCEPRGSSSSSGISSSKKSQQQLPENLQQQFVELQGEEQRLPALVHLVRTAFKHRVIVFFGVSANWFAASQNLSNIAEIIIRSSLSSKRGSSRCRCEPLCCVSLLLCRRKRRRMRHFCCFLF